MPSDYCIPPRADRHLNSSSNYLHTRGPFSPRAQSSSPTRSDSISPLASSTGMSRPVPLIPSLSSRIRTENSDEESKASYRAPHW